MTTIANCFDVNEAHRFQLLLDSAGIRSFIPDETMAGLAPYHFFTASGVRLEVAHEDAAEAERIIAESNQTS